MHACICNSITTEVLLSAFSFLFYWCLFTCTLSFFGGRGYCHYRTHTLSLAYPPPFLYIIFYVLQKNTILKRVHASTLARSSLLAPHLCRPIKLNLHKNVKLTLHSVHFFSRSVYWSDNASYFMPLLMHQIKYELVDHETNTNSINSSAQQMKTIEWMITLFGMHCLCGVNDESVCVSVCAYALTMCKYISQKNQIIPANENMHVQIYQLHGWPLQHLYMHITRFIMLHVEWALLDNFFFLAHLIDKWNNCHSHAQPISTSKWINIHKHRVWTWYGENCNHCQYIFAPPLLSLVIKYSSMPKYICTCCTYRVWGDKNGESIKHTR